MSVDPKGPAVPPDELAEEYRRRFTPLAAYRRRVWRILIDRFFQPLIGKNKTILDLGCGWGEFINGVQAAKRYGMDLNPETPGHLEPDVTFFSQDCAAPWPLEDNSLDHVFTSNFFEHLPDKDSLKRTLLEVRRCLKPGGTLICMGPNIRIVKGAYWDFFDHYVCLTERSLAEAMELSGMKCLRAEARFLPYTMVGKRQAPPWMIGLYLRFPPLWRLFGGQFLVIGEKTTTGNLQS